MSFKPVYQFLQHILIATLLFIAVAAVAIFLWYLTKLMDSWGVPDHIRLTCLYLSDFLFWLDVGCLVIYVLSEVWKWLREIYEDLRPVRARPSE